jgi:hypothetical protein
MGSGQSELHAPLQRAGERAVATGGCAEPEGAGHLLKVELEAVRMGVEGIGEAAQEPRGRRADDAEPELLDIG